RAGRRPFLMTNFRTIDRQTGYLLPPSVDEWLPEKHLARFVVEVIDGLDLGRMSGAYRGSGSASYHPRMLLGLLVYGYATGVFSSRKLERATHDSVAFRFITANDHPDHDTIATFRRRFLKDIEAPFVKSLPLRRRGCCCWRVRWACCRWERCTGWNQNSRQCQPPQRVVIRARGQGLSLGLPRGSRRN